MIAYMCKYAPIEILEAFSTPVLMLEPRTNSFPAAECCMHPNMCSYIKAVLEDFEAHDYEGMLFTTCCDSARRLYDTLVALHPEKFFYMMDLPRKINDFSVSFYEEQLESLIKAYGDFSGKAFDPDALFAMCEKEIFMQQRKKELVEKGLLPTKKSDVRICLAGARPGSAMKRRIEEMGAEIALDLTCTGISREFVLERENLLGSYAAALLHQIPCMRMGEVGRREALLKEQTEALDGIIYHRVKIWDFYGYEYQRL